MKRIDIALAVGLVLLSGFYLYHALELPQGMSRGSPRAGTFPLYLGILLVGASLVYLALAVLAQRRIAGTGPHTEAVETPAGQPVGTYVLFAIISAYVFGLWALGFLLATALFVMGTLNLYFRAAWLVSAASALIITAACYVIFEVGLKLSLPTAQLF